MQNKSGNDKWLASTSKIGWLCDCDKEKLSTLSYQCVLYWERRYIKKFLSSYTIFWHGDFWEAQDVGT